MGLEDFIQRALLVGIYISFMAGPLGCFIVWRRMAYFGDTLSHASLMGISLSLALSLPIKIGIFCVCLLIAFFILQIRENRYFAMDTILGLLAHGGLALGIFLISLFSQQINIYTYLFGDILSVTWTDVGIFAVGLLIVLAYLWYNWKSLTMLTLHEDLAKADGIKTRRLDYSFLLILTLIIALSIHIVGVLLITSLLIIPAAAARPFSSDPIQMASRAAAIGAFSIGGGLYLSYDLDTPSGPSIIVVALGIFILSNLIKKAVNS